MARKETTILTEMSEQDKICLIKTVLGKSEHTETGSTFGFYSNSGDLTILFNWLF